MSIIKIKIEIEIKLIKIKIEIDLLSNLCQNSVIEIKINRKSKLIVNLSPEPKKIEISKIEIFKFRPSIKLINQPRPKKATVLHFKSYSSLPRIS